MSAFERLFGRCLLQMLEGAVRSHWQVRLLQACLEWAQSVIGGAGFTKLGD